MVNQPPVSNHYYGVGVDVGKIIGGKMGCRVTTMMGKMGKINVPSLRQGSGKSAPVRWPQQVERAIMYYEQAVAIFQDEKLQGTRVAVSCPGTIEGGVAGGSFDAAVPIRIAACYFCAVLS